MTSVRQLQGERRVIPSDTDARRSRRLGQEFLGNKYPLPLSSATTVIMRANRSKNTTPELRLRSALHRAGLRFRVHLSVRVDGARPVVPDIAFTRQKVAVFMDGCFWHSCSIHGETPKSNSAYWRAKFARNRARDAETVMRLVRSGWQTIRIWEHEEVESAAGRIAQALLT